jgi:hypothetical protein
VVNETWQRPFQNLRGFSVIYLVQLEPKHCRWQNAGALNIAVQSLLTLPNRNFEVPVDFVSPSK